MENGNLQRVENAIEKVLKKGLSKGVFSGAAVGVYHFHKGQEQRLMTCQGRTRSDEEGEFVTRETYFDLASLTKPFCTALSILCLMQNKEIDWDTHIFDRLSSFVIHNEYKKITIEQLLTHSAGLIAYKPLYQAYPPLPGNEKKEQLIREFMRERLAYLPGTLCLYSDLGFILLGALIEKVSGTTLDDFFDNEIMKPLYFQEGIQFRRLNRPKKKVRNTAATELCPWRQKMLQGEVHDEHAWLMNGVAGHAGLFGTITGVLTLTEQILHQWKGRKTHPAFSNTLLQLALTKKYRNHSWCRGFDTPAGQGSSAGNHFSAASVGHLGYTGTSFWIDPEQEMIVVLLCNRVHPSRKNEQIKQFRPLLHNRVVEALREK
jgi:CubicO group peptidase (beta-lactamase class C family)